MKILNLKPREYHALHFDINKLPDLKAAGHLSASVMSNARDPLKMIWCQREQTNEMSWGSLIDCLWTTPSLFASEYCVIPETAPKDVRKDSRIMEAKKPSQESLDKIAWWNEFDKEVAGRIPITQALLDDAKAAVRMLEMNNLSRAIRADSRKQVALVGDSPFHDGQYKALMDLVPVDGPFVDAIVDLKTTSLMGEGALFSTAKKFDYAVKMASYCLAAESAGLGPRPRAVLIWQNSKFPYEVKVREIPQAKLESAKREIHDRIAVLQSINPTDLRNHFDTTLREMVWPEWDWIDTEEE